MDNANSKDYLEKIKIQVIENLKRTAHAPSVQMTDVPRTTMTGGIDEDDDIMDDLDEEENTDHRGSARQNDKRITRDDELDESEDEEENYKNGVRPQNGTNKRRNIMDFQNDNAVAEDIEMDSGMGTTAPPTPPSPTQNLAVPASIGEIGSNAPSRAHTPKPAVDTEGDYNMTEDAPNTLQTPAAPSPAPTTAPIAGSFEPANIDPAIVKQECEAERAEADISAEAATTKASEADVATAAAVTEANAEVNAEIMERKVSESEGIS